MSDLKITLLFTALVVVIALAGAVIGSVRASPLRNAARTESGEENSDPPNRRHRSLNPAHAPIGCQVVLNSRKSRIA